MELDESVFSAKDVQTAVGLSYRQLNDWESRGSLPHSRSSDGGWRRFSLRDLFVLMVTKEMRDKYGVSVQRLKYVQECMLRPGADHLQAAARLMAALGVGVWLLTDLEDTFFVDSELDMLDLMEGGFFGGDYSAGYFMLKLNPLVNRICSTMKDPFELPAHGTGYEILRQIRESSSAPSPGEQQVLQAIRSGKYRKIEMTLDDAEVHTIRTTATRSRSSDLEALLSEYDHQKLTTIKRDGEVVAVEQQATSRIPQSTHLVRGEEEEPHNAN